MGTMQGLARRQGKTKEASSSLGLKVLLVKERGGQSRVQPYFRCSLTKNGTVFLKPSVLSEPSSLTFVAGTVSKQAPGRGIEYPTCLGLHHTALLGPLPEEHNEQSWP